MPISLEESPSKEEISWHNHQHDEAEETPALKVIPIKHLIAVAAFGIPLFTASIMFTISSISRENIQVHNDNPSAHALVIKAATEETRKEISSKLDALSDDISKLTINQVEMKSSLATLKEYDKLTSINKATKPKHGLIKEESTKNEP